MSRHLLIFGINFAPEPTGTALNTTWWSESIAELGWEVSVVTGVPHYPSWQRGKVAPRRRHGPVRVAHRRHYVPRQQTALKRGAYELTWALSAFPELARNHPDAVLGVIPSLGGAALASLAAKRFRVPYALLFQDLMGKAAGLSGMPGAGRVAGIVSSTELALARGATAVAIVADGFRPYFVDGGVVEERVHRVRNPARLPAINEPRERVRARMGWGDEQFVVLHSGSMGYKQGLEVVVEAAAMARDERLLLVFQGDGNQRDVLGAQAVRLSLDNVRFLPLAAEEELGGVLAAADALLLNQRGSVMNMSLPAKLASYYAAGVPVLAAVSEGDEVAAEVRRAGAGLVVRPDDPSALLAGIQELRSNPSRARELGEAGARFARNQLDASALVGMVERFLEEVFPPQQKPKVTSLPAVGRVLNHVPGPMARHVRSDRLPGRLLKPLVDPMLPAEHLAVTVRGGRAAGIQLLIDGRSEKYYWTGSYERPIQEYLAAVLKTGDVIWDIGAHAGFFSLLASRLVGPNGRVHAFEPLPSNADRLEAAIRLNGAKNVTVHRLAIDAASGQTRLYVGSSSSTSRLAKNGNGYSVPVATATLTAMGETLGPPHLIKIDIEGAEGACLAGAQGLLAIARPHVIVELHDDSAPPQLPGYRIVELSGSHVALVPEVET